MTEPSTDEREALARVLYIIDYRDVPEAAEESNTTWTLPVLSSYRAIGVKVVPLAKSLSFSTAQTSR